MTNAICYLRVSSDLQESNTSLTSQATATKRYCDEHGFTVVGTYSDTKSGGSLDRPGIQQVRELFAQGVATELVVYALDRLSRQLIDLLVLREEFRRKGVTLHTVTRGVAGTTPEEDAMISMEGIFAQFEKAKITHRLALGRRTKTRQGKWSGMAFPYGYSKVGTHRDSELVVNEAEAAVVRDVYIWYVRDGLSMTAIAKRLTLEGVPTPQSHTSIRKYPGWGHDTIRLMLRNKTYKGIMVFADVETAMPELALVSEELWEQAQAKRERNAVLSKRNRKYQCLLSGYLFCKCGWRMHAANQSQRWWYYACGNANAAYRGACNEHRLIRQEVADTFVWEFLRRLLTSEDYLMSQVRQTLAQRESGLGGKRDRLEVVTSLLAKTEGQMERLASGLATASNSVVQAAIIKQMDDLARQQTALQMEAKDLQQQIAANAVSEDDIEAIRQLAASLRDRTNNATIEEKRALLETLQVRCDLDYQDGVRVLKVRCTLVNDTSVLRLEPRSINTSSST